MCVILPRIDSFLYSLAKILADSKSIIGMRTSLGVCILGFLFDFNRDNSCASRRLSGARVRLADGFLGIDFGYLGDGLDSLGVFEALRCISHHSCD